MALNIGIVIKREVPEDGERPYAVVTIDGTSIATTVFGVAGPDASVMYTIGVGGDADAAARALVNSLNDAWAKGYNAGRVVASQEVPPVAAVPEGDKEPGSRPSPTPTPREPRDPGRDNPGGIGGGKRG